MSVEAKGLEMGLTNGILDEVTFRRLSPGELTARAGRMILSAVGEDPTREGLLRTPERFSKALMDLTSGYRKTPAEVVGEGVFQAEGPGLVSVRGTEFYSLCEHHVVPFWGTASVAYYPGSRILGLSKIPRLIELFSRRLQVQERLGEQIADALEELISPRAVVVRITARHLCMMMRGVEKQSAETVTETWRGLELLSQTERDRIWESV